MPKNVKELQEMVERCFHVGPSTDGPLSVTGEKYVEIGLQQTGVVPPSQPGVLETLCLPPVLYNKMKTAVAWDESTACELAWLAFKLYAKGKSGVLYWRMPPQMEKDDAGLLQVYMRLLVSDKPVPKSAPEVDAFARAAHEVCRCYGVMVGELVDLKWEFALKEERDALIEIVCLVIEHPTMSPAAIHSKWWVAQEKKGWTAGDTRDAARKVSDKLRYFHELPPYEQALLNLTVIVVRSMLGQVEGK